MSDKTIYLKMDAKVKLSTDVVRVGDLGKIYCEESTIVNKVKTLQIYRIQKSDHNRCVIGVLKVIELIHQEYPTYMVDIVGETEKLRLYQQFVFSVLCIRLCLIIMRLVLLIFLQICIPWQQD